MTTAGTYFRYLPQKVGALPIPHLVGFVAPFVGLLGGWWCIAALTALLLLYRDIPASEPAPSPWGRFLPLAVVLSSWVATTAFEGIAAQATAPVGALSQLLVQPFGFRAAAFELLRLTGGLVLLRHLVSNPTLRHTVIRGVLHGTVLAALLCGVQVAVFLVGSGEEIFLRDQRWFWTAQQRLSGVFTDPNAFGVFAFLAIAIAVSQFERHRKLAQLVIAGVLCVVPFSGSRTFIVGTVLWAIAMLLLTVRRRISLQRSDANCSGSRRPLIIATAVIALAVAVLSAAPQLASNLRTPAAVDRAFSALNPFAVSATVETRQIFTQIGVELFANTPLFGVGPGRFSSQVVGSAERLGLGTGLWYDNANNFYLGVVVETGLTGLLALLFGCSAFAFRPGGAGGARLGFLVFLALLFVGPHIAFPEVAFAALLLGAELLVIRPAFAETTTRWVRKLSLVCGVAVCLAAGHRSFGFYHWERGRELPYRWTGAAARGELWCDPAAPLTVRLRTLEPGVSRNPVLVTAEFGRDRLTTAEGGQRSQKVIVQESRSDSSPVELPLTCEHPGWVRFKVRSSRVWQAPGGEDSRLLGLQLFGVPPARMR